MVGGGAVFDDAGQEDRLKCLLPDSRRLRGDPRGAGRGPDRPAGAEPDRRSVGDRRPSATWPRSYPDSRRPRRLPHRRHRDDRDRQPTRSSRRSDELGFKTVYDARTTPLGEPSWTAVRPGHQERRRQGPALDRRAREPGQAAPGAGRHRLRARLGHGRRQPLRPEAHRHRRRGGEERVRRRRGRPVLAGRREPRHPAVPRPVREVPARRQEQGLPRLPGVLGLAAVRPGGQGVRRRPHPQVRVRQGLEVTEWTGGGLHAPTNPKESSAGGVRHPHRGHAGRLRGARRLRGQRGDLQLRPRERVHAQG